MHAIVKNKLLIVTYLLTVLYALHFGIPLYATSTYLHQFFNTSYVNLLYMLGSIFSLIASIYFSRFIKLYHTYRFTAFLVFGEIITIILFALAERPLLIGLLFIIHFILQILLYICLNIYIESFSKHTETGSIRGLFLVLINCALIIAPIIGGTVLTHGTFQTLYIVSAITLIPFFFLLKKFLYHIEEPVYRNMNMLGALKSALRNKDLKGILIAGLIVECFYAVMIIYSPIYLQIIGIPLTTYLTIILPFALIPLVVLPYELGLLADTKWGEKEMLLVGLAILAFSVFLCVIITSSNPYVWIVILLISRIGASFVETMVFSYYFKKVGPEDSSLTALFSNTRPLSNIIVGGIGISIAPLLVQRPQLVFVILGCAILISISYVLPIKDSR